MRYRTSNNYNPILVTGSHRSGTTWVGRMLATFPYVAYIPEIFNNRFGLLKKQDVVSHDYLYLKKEGDNPALVKEIENILQYNFFKLHSGSTLVLSLKNSYRYLSKILTYSPRPLLKDPLAALSSEYLARKFSMRVVVVVRHPAAFTYSLKRLGWDFDVSLFLNQPLLMRDHLGEYKRELLRWANDDVGAAAIAWKCIYHVLKTYMERNPNWIVCRHEDLSMEPINQFRHLYEMLNITFTKRSRRKIERHSDPANPVTALGNVEHYLYRDSRSNIKIWEKYLAVREVDKIRRIVDDVSKCYYSEDDW
ncbi:MAG: sulfotransferase [Bacteroidetes bacterium]|nr:sulfotransferase [Bacteroidota bacterium]